MKELGSIPDNDDDIVPVYEDLPDAEPMVYEHDYGMGVNMVCSLAVELRVLRGGTVLRAMVGA